MRAAQFSPEDNEHLHHRASELAAYARPLRGPSPATTSSDPETPTSPASSEERQSPSLPDPDADVVPISELFYAEEPADDVSTGQPRTAAETSDLLGKGISALDQLEHEPLAPAASIRTSAIVPVERLVYKGRSALERAGALREQLRATGGPPPAHALEEIYDLIGLALKE
jgi:hypothetical protein